jgi:23S rRNA (uridine2552-2'-O)-methyltransferase
MGRVRGRPWLQEHLADAHVKRARAEGLRSRAAYKLAEIAERDRLLGPGMTVVDLGAAPGGWSQLAAGRVGRRGRVIALDVLDMAPVAGVTFIRGDLRDSATRAELDRTLGGLKADLVISDMAPNLTGIASADQARVARIAELALEIALKHLKPQGNLLVKSFHGAGFDDYVRRLRGCFRSVAVRKPEASRSRSSEVYLVAKGLRADAAQGGRGDEPGQMR